MAYKLSRSHDQCRVKISAQGDILNTEHNEIKAKLNDGVVFIEFPKRDIRISQVAVYPQSKKRFPELNTESIFSDDGYLKLIKWKNPRENQVLELCFSAKDIPEDEEIDTSLITPKLLLALVKYLREKELDTSKNGE